MAIPKEAIAAIIHTFSSNFMIFIAVIFDVLRCQNRSAKLSDLSLNNGFSEWFMR
jgi:hypothetical protein